MTGLNASTLWSAYLLAKAGWMNKKSENRFRKMQRFGRKLTEKIEASEKELDQHRAFVSFSLHKNDERDIAAMKSLGMDITKEKSE